MGEKGGGGGRREEEGGEGRNGEIALWKVSSTVGQRFRMESSSNDWFKHMCVSQADGNGELHRVKTSQHGIEKIGREHDRQQEFKGLWYHQ